MKRERFKEWEGLKEASVLSDIQLDELMEEEEHSDVWKQAVSFDRWIIYRKPLLMSVSLSQVIQLSQCLLLQTASPDAFVRLENTSLADQQAVLLKLYNEVQHHASLEDFLEHHLNQSGLQGGLLLQVRSHDFHVMATCSYNIKVTISNGAFHLCCIQ